MKKGVLLLICLAMGSFAVGKDADKKPNIVFVIVDSHRSDVLGANGHPIIKTPNIDQLARGGLNFQEAYVTTAICAVSRASILSGQYQQRHRINDFTSDFSESAWQKTYPMQLKKAGYQVAQIGFLGVGKNPPSGTFDHWDVKIPWKSEGGVHEIDVVTQKAVSFIEKQQESDAPFYLAVSYMSAHEIDPRDGVPAHYLIQDRHQDLYKDTAIPLPVSASNEHWESFPPFFKTDQNIARARWKGFISDDSLLRENTRNYYRLITGLDEAVGSIVQSIRKRAPNTIIIYVSDHGFSLGEHGLMGKWYGFNEGIHVPLIISDLRKNPVIPVGVSRNLALNIDIAPTIMGIAGIKADPEMQGIDLIGAHGNKKARRSEFFYEHTVFPSPLLPKMEGVVGKDFKYMLFTEHDFELFYDRKKDKYELNNLVDSSKNRKALKRYRQLYTQYKQSLP